MSADPAGAFRSFLDKWLEAEPDARLLRLFVAEARAPETCALLVLMHELEAAALGMDPQPAQAKLGWWQEELQRWRAGAARHPITVALGVHPAAADVATLPAAAASWLALETVGSHAQWLDAARRCADAQARALSGGEGGGSDPATVLARALLRFPRLAADPRGLLPLDVLAESAATRAEVAAAPHGEPARRTLAALARRALATPAPDCRSELLLARSWLARQALERVARGQDPERAARPGLRTVLGLRRALRRSRIAR